MDTTEIMRELRKVERESDRRFERLLQRLVGMPAAEGVQLAEQLLADHNRHHIEMAMRVKAFFGGAVH
jgi:hypothetical protein